VPLGRNCTQPSCTARVARGRSAARVRGPLGLGQPAQRAAHGGVAQQPNGGAPPVHGRRPRKRGGSLARGRRRGTTATGERRGCRGGTATVRATAASDRGGRDGGARGEVSGCRGGGARGEACGRAADAARSGAYLSSRACVRTAPPTAANHGSARRDTATDRRAPRVS
jgi:hypothetical protein